MLRKSKYMVRMAIALMLFQFLSPAFIPLVVQEIPTDEAVAFHEQHNSIVAPTFLKEKDEKEDSKFSTINASAAILDFASHSFNLTASHSNKYSNFAGDVAFIQPQRFALFCTLLIWSDHLLSNSFEWIRHSELSVSGKNSILLNILSTTLLFFKKRTRHFMDKVFHQKIIKTFKLKTLRLEIKPLGRLIDRKDVNKILKHANTWNS